MAVQSPEPSVRVAGLAMLSEASWGLGFSLAVGFGGIYSTNFWPVDGRYFFSLSFFFVIGGTSWVSSRCHKQFPGRSIEKKVYSEILDP